MKKLVSLLLVLTLSLIAVSAFAATGIGSITTISGNDATDEKDGSATVNTTICALTLDDEGKIVAVKFDVAQNKVGYDNAGEWIENESAKEAGYLTKVELGDDYSMKAVSEIGKEIYEQIAALEEYCVGKTVEEVLNIKTFVKDDAHQNVPDEDDLKSVVTIDVGGYLAALAKAGENAK